MQKRNPFEPPLAPVDGLDPPFGADVPQMRRPAAIDRAFWLIVGSAVLGVLSYVARGMHESAFTVTFVWAWLIGFAFLIRAGRNWARIVYLVFFLLGGLGMLLVGAALARLGTIYLVIIGLQTVFQGYAAWLAFRPPGSQWFGRFRILRS